TSDLGKQPTLAGRRFSSQSWRLFGPVVCDHRNREGGPATMAKQNPALPALPPLRLEWRSPAELAENPRNWRTPPDTQLAALTDVIAEVGWAGACLFNERTQRLIDGHLRKRIGIAQGTDKIPVLIGNWSEEQERKILTTLDPIGALAEADSAKLET